MRKPAQLRLASLAMLGLGGLSALGALFASERGREAMLRLLGREQPSFEGVDAQLARITGELEEIEAELAPQ
jgi:hypothetical protein